MHALTPVGRYLVGVDQAALQVEPAVLHGGGLGDQKKSGVG
jgi:hypothetical protein